MPVIIAQRMRGDPVHGWRQSHSPGAQLAADL